MNTFYEHHQDNIKFGYRCFDRILFNGLIQPFQQPERVIGFFNAYREGQRVTRNLCAILPSNFRTGSKIVAKNGARRFWMRRKEGVTTLSIPTLSSQERPGSGDSQSQGTGPDHGCRRQKTAGTCSWSNAGSRNITFTLTISVGAECSFASVPICPFRTRVPQSTPLAG